MAESELPEHEEVAMTTYVLVHGAWHGGWCWSRVARRLRAAGHEVHTPTLTGLGERAHLLTPEVGLDTHVRDVTAVLEYEDLHQVVLVGHSYAGSVIGGVAEVAAERLGRLVYLDGFVPADGESVFDHFPADYRDRFRTLAAEQGDGWRIPAVPTLLDAWGITDAADRQWVGSLISDFPLRCFEQPARLPRDAAATLPRTYVAATAYPAAAAVFAPQADRARREGWPYHELATGHDAMVSLPGPLTEILLDEGPSARSAARDRTTSGKAEV
jgi:pimeloyl-ACP methyl ester carboxylesterase